MWVVSCQKEEVCQFKVLECARRRVGAEGLYNPYHPAGPAESCAGFEVVCPEAPLYELVVNVILFDILRCADIHGHGIRAVLFHNLLKPACNGGSGLIPTYLLKTASVFLHWGYEAVFRIKHPNKILPKDAELSFIDRVILHSFNCHHLSLGDTDVYSASCAAVRTDGHEPLFSLWRILCERLSYGPEDGVISHDRCGPDRCRELYEFPAVKLH